MSCTLKHIIVLSFLLITSVYAQETKKEFEPQLVDYFGKTTGDDRSARFDNFFIQLNKNPGAIGYIFVYCGKSCRYGEIESHLRGIELKINGYKFDRERLVVLNGGYRDDQEIELWLKVKGASTPTPRSTRSIKNVTFLKPNRRIIEPYDCCDELDGLWKDLRPRS